MKKTQSNGGLNLLKWSILVILISMSSTFFACIQPSGTAEAGMKAPDFSLKDVNGNVVTLSNYRGKVVLIDFWATWCPPCRMELPHFKKIHQKYADKNFVILGIAIDDDAKVKKFVQKEKIPFTIAHGDRETAKAYNVRAFPTTFLLDTEGNVKYNWVGYKDQAVFEKAIDKLLTEK